MNKIKLLQHLGILLFLTQISYSQVGIGTTTPAGALDLNPTIATNYGLVTPRVALTATNAQAPVVNPQGGAIPIGTIVYNTATAGTAPNDVGPGLYYWNGGKWIAFAGSAGGLDWSLTGNTGTTAGINFIGTTDVQDLRIKTGVGGINRWNISSTNGQLQSYGSGSAANPSYSFSPDSGTGIFSPGLNMLGFSTNRIERMRILANGHILVNETTNDVTSGADNIFEVLATTSGDDAINGYATGTGIGVYGTTTGAGIGVRGDVNSTTGIAILGVNTNTTGPGIIGSGGNATLSYYTTAGINGNGLTTGVAGMATTVSDGVGVRGNGNGLATNTTSGVGAGVAGSGTRVGVFGHASETTGSKNGGVFTSEHGSAGTGNNPYAYLAGSDGTLVYGGYFDGNQDNNGPSLDYAYVGVVSGGTTYKILGTGSVSTMVKDENNQKRILFAPESPEILFQDYGVGKLTNGTATINLDPILAKNIFINEKHPLKVFIQLEGDCNGVFVTNKTATGFTVKELKNGKSNTPFSWQIIANRADMLDSNGNIHSKHVDVRFPVGPEPIKYEREIKTELVKPNEKL